MAPRERILEGTKIGRIGRLNEIGGALDGLTPFEPDFPVPVATVKNLAWVIPAARGRRPWGRRDGALTHASSSSGREIGLFAGGVLGAAGLVALVGVLASRPDIAGGLETGLKWVGFIALPLGFWRGICGGRPLGWLTRWRVHAGVLVAVGDGAAPDVLPSRAEVLAALDDPIGRLLLHDADLVLAWCWAHPARLGQAPRPPLRTAEPLSCSVCRRPGDTARHPGRSVIGTGGPRRRRRGDAPADPGRGLRMEVGRAGRLTTLTMASLFSKFGMIDVGQPVETLKPATVRDGVAVQQGVIRRLRV